MVTGTRQQKKSDLLLLQTVAEFGLLTLGQMAVLLGRNQKALARRLGQLESAGVIRRTSRGFGRGRGRPEIIVSLTTDGLATLSEAGGFNKEDVHEKRFNLDPSCIDHQLLVNWFRVQLVHLERVNPLLAIRFLAPTSPFLGRDDNGRLLVFDKVSSETDEQGSIDLIPDGVFSITYTTEETAKALLFFLEVDMGTESLVSRNSGASDIRGKVLSYQSYFRSRGYKRYERVWDRQLNGFRVLILTHAGARNAAIRRLVQEMKPSDFFWVSDQQRMFDKGLGAEIWARGGMDQKPLESILGRLAMDHAAIPSG